MTDRDVLRLLRKKQGELTSRRFAEDVLHCTPQYLSDIYAGKRPPAKLILKFLGLRRYREVTVVTHYRPEPEKNIAAGRR